MRSSDSYIICPKCQSTHINYMGDLANHFGCRNCRNLLKREDGEWKFASVLPDLLQNIYLPIGSHGFIENEKFTVVAQLIKNDREGYSWREYRLLSNTGRITFLSEFKGNWIFLEETEYDLNFRSEELSVTYKAKQFNKYSRYSYRILSVFGEINEHPHIGDFVFSVGEFINPPELISVEKSDVRVAYYKGRHVSGREVRSIFSVAELPPAKTDVGVIEPGPFTASFKESVIISLIGVFIMFVFYALFNASHPKQKIYQDRFGVDSVKKVHVSPVVKFENGTKNLEIELGAVLRNNWLGAQIDFVNIDNGKVISVYYEIEHYFGVSGGENWVEGGNNGSALVSSVPEGNYRMEISFQSGSKDYSFVTLTINRNAPFLRNFLICVLLLAVYPAILYFVKHNFEVRRWSNSNYSPYMED